MTTKRERDEVEGLGPLGRLDVFEKAAATGELPLLIEDLKRASAARSAGDPAGQALALLARALRIDLAFLVDHPAEVLSCLYNRCRFPETSAASGVVARWADERGARGRPWVQSLRPPRFGLDGPLLEEYRGDLEHPRAVRMERGDTISVRFGFCGRVQDCRWDRATGRRLPLRQVDDGADASSSSSHHADGSVDENSLVDVDLSPDGCWRVERRRLGEVVRLVSVADGSVRWTLEKGAERVSGVAFFADGARLLLSGDAADEDDDFAGCLTIVDAASGQTLGRIETSGTPYHPAVSADGRWIAAHLRDNVIVWAWETGQVVTGFATGAQALSFGAGGRTLATVAEGVVRVWEVEPGRTAPGIAGTRDHLSSALFSPDGERLITGQLLCDARTGATITHLGHMTSVYLEGGPTMPPLRLLDRVVVCLDRGISLWDARTGQPIPRPDGNRDELFFFRHLVAVSADGRRYAVTESSRWGRVPGEKRSKKEEVRIADLADGRELARFRITAASSMELSPDGARLLVGSADGVARVWDATSGRLLAKFEGHAARHDVSGVAFLKDGGFAASGAEDEALCVWDARTGAERRRRPLGDRDGHFVSYPGGEHRYWHPSPAAVADVEAWAGLRPPRRWAAEPAAGAIRIVDGKTGEAIAWLAASGGVAPHPDAPIWAAGPLHFKLAGVA